MSYASHDPLTPPRLLLRHDKERVLALRESFIEICNGDQFAAHLINAMERVTLYVCQTRHLTGTPFIETSAERWAAELLHICTERTIRKKFDLLVNLGFVILKHEPGRAPLWQLQVHAINDALRKVKVRSGAAPDADAASAPVVDLSGKPIRRSAPVAATHRPAAPTPEQVPTPTTTPEQTPPSPSTPSGAPRNFFSSASLSGVFSKFSEKQNSTSTETRDPSPAPTSSSAERNTPTPHLTGPVGERRVQTGRAAAQRRSGQHATVTVPAPRPAAPDPGTPSAVRCAAANPGTSSAPPGTPAVTPAYPDEQAVTDPNANRRLLVQALGGERRLTQLLSEPVRHSDGRVQRAMWLTAIPLARVQEIITEARHNTRENPWTYITRSLDLELTGPRVHSPPSHTINPASYDVKPSVVHEPPRPPSDALERVAVGTTHTETDTGRLVTIAAVVRSPLSYVVTDGQEETRVSAWDMFIKYQPVVAAQTLAQPT